MKYHACIFHLPETEFDYVEETLLEYHIGAYLIAYENEPYPHYHLLFEAEDKIYNAYSKRLIEKYQLRGKPQKGKARQYGKIKNIENLEKLKTYMCKDGNIRSNINDEQLNIYIENSFKKEEKNTILKEMLNYIDSTYKTFEIKEEFINSNNNYRLYNIKNNIIEYMLEKNIKINKGFVNNAIIYYIQNTEKLSLNQKREMIMYRL